MINSPFFRNYTNQQSSRSIPVQKTGQKSAQKVISVPVQFISSDQSQPKPRLVSNNSAAITIQKVFRSFLVRKCVNNIKSIKTEVTEIERKINDIETVNLIRNNPKEKLRINETLMSLLFKLDSIRGIDSGVREFRKTVTKKAIALQEKVDSIAQSDTGTETVKIADQQVTETVENDEAAKEGIEECDSVKVDSIAQSDKVADQVTETVENDEAAKECDSVKVVEGSKVLEKLTDDNEKMMKLMMQICERNEMQTRVINSLSRRVEQLEKGFMNDNKLRKKKKTNSGLRRRDRDDFYF